MLGTRVLIGLTPDLSIAGPMGEMFLGGETLPWQGGGPGLVRKARVPPKGSNNSNIIVMVPLACTP